MFRDPTLKALRFISSHLLAFLLGLNVIGLAAQIGTNEAVYGRLLGTGVASALATNVGSAGAPVLFNGAGGTPSSIDLTNATNNFPSDPTYGGVLKNATFKRVSASTGATGDLDLYTVPSNKRALVYGYLYYNTSVGNIAVLVQAKISGTYYRMAATVNSSSDTETQTGSNPFQLEAGDILSINTATNTGLNIYFAVIEFDDSSPLHQGRLVGTTTGDNTVYTCPALKSCAMVNNAQIPFLGSTAGLVITTAGTGANFYSNVVPSGDSVATANRSSSLKTISTNTRVTTVTGVTTLGAGDFVSVNSSAGHASQVVFFPVIER